MNDQNIGYLCKNKKITREHFISAFVLVLQSEAYNLSLNWILYKLSHLKKQNRRLYSINKTYYHAYSILCKIKDYPLSLYFLILIILYLFSNKTFPLDNYWNSKIHTQVYYTYVFLYKVPRPTALRIFPQWNIRFIEKTKRKSINKFDHITRSSPLRAPITYVHKILTQNVTWACKLKQGSASKYLLREY